MAPSIPLVAALLRLSNAELDESSLLQIAMPLADLNQDECRCPGYYQEECEAEHAQGCRWSDAGSTNKPWCQCLADPVAVPVAPVTLPPVTAPPVTAPPVTAAPVSDESFCAAQCQAAGHCCNDPSIGSNQQISCAQACMMRASGQRMDAMLSANGGICNRRGNSGCSLEVQGQSYSFCQSCQDLQDHCPHGVQSSDECDFGASLLPPSAVADPEPVYPVTAPPAVSPTHYLTVTSWPHDHWGQWDSEARNSPIEVCRAKDQTEETDGSGYFFTSCCASDGSGMSRDCGTTRNTDFETASAQCESQGGRLCSAEEAISTTDYITASQGCSVDGPSGATGSDLNRLWTSTPCNPEVVPTDPVGEPNVNYNLVHQGHCASGWISGHNTLQADIEACHVHCSENANCGYFAFSENMQEGQGTNCALYTACGGCDDDTNFEHYNAYQLSDRSCQAQCAPAQDSTVDAGYNDAYRGWYDVQGCGECNDYCRWVGNTGSLGDPSVNFHRGQESAGNPSWWSCRLAGTTDVYSARGLFTSFDYPRCAGQR